MDSKSIPVKDESSLENTDMNDIVVDEKGETTEDVVATSNAPTAPSVEIESTPPPDDSVIADEPPVEEPKDEEPMTEDPPKDAPNEEAPIEEPMPEEPTVEPAPTEPSQEPLSSENSGSFMGSDKVSKAESVMPGDNPVDVVTPASGSSISSAAPAKKSAKGMIVVVAVALAVILAVAVTLLFLMALHVSMKFWR